MSHPVSFTTARDPLPDHEQKQAALSYLNEAWAEAARWRRCGLLAQASACSRRSPNWSEPITRRGGEIRGRLPVRVRNGEFSTRMAKQ